MPRHGVRQRAWRAAPILERDNYPLVTGVAAGAEEAAMEPRPDLRCAIEIERLPDVNAALQRIGAAAGAGAAVAWVRNTVDDALDGVAQLADIGNHAVMMSTPEGWRDTLRRSVLAIFNDLVPLDAMEELDPERLVAARRNLVWGLTGYGKGGSAFFGALGLPPPEIKRKAGRAA